MYREVIEVVGLLIFRRIGEKKCVFLQFLIIKEPGYVPFSDRTWETPSGGVEHLFFVKA